MEDRRLENRVQIWMLDRDIGELGTLATGVRGLSDHQGQKLGYWGRGVALPLVVTYAAPHTLYILEF